MTTTTQATDKRTRLIQAAAELVHQQGFHPTTIADIARSAGVPPGNVYYYFKTKESLAEALIEQQRAGQQALRREWDADPDPRHRLRAFIQMAVDSGPDLARRGCPTGSLCTELGKAGGPLAEQAGALLAQWITWIEEQFRALDLGDESPGLAVHLLAALQGASLLTHSFGTPSYVEGEARRLAAWIDAL